MPEGQSVNNFLVLHVLSSEVSIFLSDFSDPFSIEGLSGRNFLSSPDFSRKNCEFSLKIDDFLDFLRGFPTFRDGFRGFLALSRDFSQVFLIFSSNLAISSLVVPKNEEEIEEEITIERISSDHVHENFGLFFSDESIF
jgi:hypothetical protein